MPIDTRLVSRKLKQARELQSLPVEAVSELTAIGSDRLSLIESGQSKPSGDEVMILVSFYRHDFLDFLDDSRPAPFEQTEILYRRHGHALTPNDRRGIRELV